MRPCGSSPGDATERLLDHLAAVDLADGAARAAARRCVLDWAGVALAGAGDPAAVAVRGLVGAGAASLVGSGGARAAVLDAAWANAMAGHVLDYDDTHLGMLGHPSATLVPALLAVAETQALPGAGVVDGLLVGVEAMSWIGHAAAPALAARGWHPTAVLGALGVAVAITTAVEARDGVAGGAPAVGAPRERLRTALTLATGLACGTQTVFGTPGKPLQVASAARAGLQAALLAGGHASAPDDPLGRFLTTFLGAPVDLPAPGATVPGVAATLPKLHAACFATHGAIECVRELGVRGEDVERVDVAIAPEFPEVARATRPQTGTELKFSLAGAVALALLGNDTADASTFSDELAGAPALGDLLPRIACDVDPALRSGAATMTATTRDGRRRTACADPGAGRPAAELERLVAAKFTALARPRIGVDEVARVAALVAGLDAAGDVRPLAAVLAAYDDASDAAPDPTTHDGRHP